MSEFLSAYFRRFGTEAYSYQTVLIELLLIGAGVYVVLRFLRGTRGAGLLKGIGVLVVASFFIVDVLADRFGWQRIEFLYTNFAYALLLAALIIFQPELRRGIMRLGEARWLRQWTSDVDRVIDELVASAEHLAANEIGAIVAVEQDTALGALADAGAVIDADVKAELLNAIFHPGSPLHDMGVVIRQGRIAAASCPFPMAEGDDLPTDWGSRHRAALGLSQESDALVIVVSEETGAISVAQAGRLERHLTPEQLGERLRTALQSAGGDEKQLLDTAPSRSEAEPT